MSTALPSVARRPWQEWVGLGARLVLGGVIFAAGALKVFELGTSINAVRGYQLLPYELIAPVGVALPFVEIVLGTLLLAGLVTRWSGLAGGALMLVFAVAIASAWARGLSIDCGCFGGGGQIELDKALAAYPWEIARDLGLAACGAWLFWRPRTAFSLDGRLFAPVGVSTDEDAVASR
ncbi:MAG: MauE/DoxX family redox-associated membrane protein [Actinomycetes bacterium]